MPNRCLEIKFCQVSVWSGPPGIPPRQRLESSAWDYWTATSGDAYPWSAEHTHKSHCESDEMHHCDPNFGLEIKVPNFGLEINVQISV